MTFRRSMIAAVLTAALMVSGTIYATAGGNDTPDPVGDGDAAVPAAIGPRVSESGFVALTQPCRLLDTRNAGGPLVAGVGRHFQADAGNLAAQGGSSTGCGIPPWATGLATNMTAIAPAGTGFLRAKPFDGTFTMPNATLLNYESGFNISNGVVVPLNAANLGGFEFDFSVLTFTSSTGLVIDAIGYYALPFYAVVEADGNFVAQNRFVTVTRSGAGAYDLTTLPGQDIRGCNISASQGTSDPAGSLSFGFGGILADGDSATTLQIFTVNAAGTAEDRAFMVVIDC